MIGQLVDNMQKKRDDFQVCHDSTAEFVRWDYDKPDQLSKTDVDLVVEESLPIRRKRRRKFMAGELSIGEVSSASDPVKKHNIEVYNRIHFYAIVDTILRSIKQRFDRTSPTLFADISRLHPRNFGMCHRGLWKSYLLRSDDEL